MNEIGIDDGGGVSWDGLAVRGFGVVLRRDNRMSARTVLSVTGRAQQTDLGAAPGRDLEECRGDDWACVRLGGRGGVL